jgi:hypothetical protein
MEALFAEGFPAFITADQTMTGTAQEWERWAGMPLPASGRYVIPRDLRP